MYQAHAQQLLNQKEYDDAGNVHPLNAGAGEHYLITATHRLAAALDRLELSLANTKQGDVGEQLMFFERENDTLRTEHAKVSEALSRLQGQYDELHQSASTIYDKLHDSIKRVNSILES